MNIHGGSIAFENHVPYRVESRGLDRNGLPSIGPNDILMGVLEDGRERKCRISIVRIGWDWLRDCSPTSGGIIPDSIYGTFIGVPLVTNNKVGYGLPLSPEVSLHSEVREQIPPAKGPCIAVAQLTFGVVLDEMLTKAYPYRVRRFALKDHIGRNLTYSLRGQDSCHPNLRVFLAYRLTTPSSP